MRMTIEEAIAHAREVAEEKYNDGFLCHANPDDGKLDECVKCAQEHEQLAEWLEELKTYREKIVSADMTQTMLKEQYNKAIDDFETWLKAEKHKAIDEKTGELLIARDGVWVNAFETFKKDAIEQWNRRVRS